MQERQLQKTNFPLSSGVRDTKYHPSCAMHGIQARLCRADFQLEQGVGSVSGITCLLELYDCPPDILNDQCQINDVLREAVDHANATLLQQVSRKFNPQGVTALGILAESHISIHTWPEHGYAAIDVFTCGDRAMPERACNYLAEAFSAAHHTVRRIERGAELGAATDKLVPKPVCSGEPVEA